MANQTDYGSVIAGLSTLAGVNEDAIALQAIALMKGLGGSFAGYFGLGGQLILSSFNLLSVDGSMKQRTLSELLLEPARKYQGQLRGLSQSVSGAALTRLEVDGPLPREFGPIDRAKYEFAKFNEGETHRLAEFCEAGGFDHRDLDRIESGTKGGSYSLASLALSNRVGRLLRQPSIMLESPVLEQMPSMLDEVHDRAPLIVDPGGCFLQRLFGPGVSPAGRKVRTILELLLQGGDSRCGPVTRDQGPGSIERQKGNFLGTLSLTQAVDLLSDGGSGFADFLKNCVVTGLPNRPPATVPDPQIERAYKSYRNILKDVIAARRSGRGMTFRLTPNDASRFRKFEIGFINRLDRTSQEVKPYIAGLAAVPSSLLWGLGTLYQAEEKGQPTFNPFLAVEKLSAWVYEAHVKTVEAVLAKVRHRQMEAKALEMCRKLAGIEPCPVRELLRTYRKQSRELHQPVIDYLFEVRYVTKQDDGSLALTELVKSKLRLPA